MLRRILRGAAIPIASLDNPSTQNSNQTSVHRSFKWMAVGFAVVLLLTALLLRYAHTAAVPVAVTYLHSRTNKNGAIDAWVRIANSGKLPISYNMVSRECNTNGVWQVVAPVLGGGEVRAGAIGGWPIPVETLGVPWRVKVGYRYRTRGVHSIAHRLDEIYERVRGKRVSVRYETNWHFATSEAFVP